MLSRTKIHFTAALSLIGSYILCPTVHAEPAFALGVEAGTTGLGASTWFSASDQLSFNLGFGALDRDDDYTTDGVDYSGNVNLSNGFAILQWHPGGGPFHLSAGAVLADNQVSVVGQPQDGTTYEIGGVSYPATQVGSILGDVDWENALAPYIGLGWAKAPRKEGWGLFLNVGVMQSGSAQASLDATGLIANDPTFQANLRAEEQSVNDELDEFDLFPVARIGLMYRF